MSSERPGALHGKRCLVVGAGSGIGRAVVDAFVAEGARVAVLERDTAKCDALRSAIDVVVCGDAVTASANDEAVGAAVEAFGGLDALVQCVGVYDFGTRLGDLDAEQLDRAFAQAFDVNVRSQLHSVRAALPHLRRSHGSITLTGSTSSFYPSRGGILYVASKFALRGVVMSLAHELAPDVRVNGVAPGGTVGTDLRGLDSLGLGERRLDDAPDRAASIATRLPLGIALEPTDHAGSYVFLASDAARAMTGTFLHPDGGMSVIT
jgi:NAD(P)-dependent dehydrogenase (short-subunit alcohol dehydrogenase family)